MATAAMFLLCAYGVRGHILWLGKLNVPPLALLT